jgi:multidrug efflux pump
MNISKFFIDRPIFAAVLSIVIFIAGLISMFGLPISEYPEVVPPSVVVSAYYNGASPTVIADTVAGPLEEQINGVENMLYMYSQATTDGRLSLTVVFKLGTDPDQAQQLVQNRVSQALPRLPDTVKLFGVTTAKSSPDLTMVVHITSPNDRYDSLYLRNYAVLNIKDQLSRLQGIGQVNIFGSGDYAMRIWLDPIKMAARHLTTGDVTRAIREQNVQVAAGVIGANPAPKDVNFQLSVVAQGRLQTPEEFGEIVLKTEGKDGAITRLRDVARVELDASEYGLRSLLNNKQAVALPIFQAPGSNAIQLSEDVRKKMAELKNQFPDGVDYSIVYDPTVFVRDSIKAVVHTLFEALALVVIVVVVFLQSWRASIIPLVAVPVSIVGTFAVMHLFGFSINALSLFGLVLAIGIVVDDAIVVVENVESNMERGLSPRDATVKAMQEVSGPIIAIGLTLIAVFVPIAFISGLTGQFYRQFALTIAISTVISAFNSLTLSPALTPLLLRAHDAPKDWLSRQIDRVFGGFFRWFNRVFKRSSDGYSRRLGGIIKRRPLMMAVYALLVAATWVQFNRVPGGFIPAQDKQYLVAFAQLPDAASLERSEAVIRNMSDIALKHPGVESAVAFPGLSINGFAVSPSAGIVFITLKPFVERRSPELSGKGIAQDLNLQFAGIKEAFVAVFPPPAVQGLGTIGGFKLQLEDRGDLGYTALYNALQTALQAARKDPALAGVFSGYQIGVPQLEVSIDRVKAKQLGVTITDVFDTMQAYLGSVYVNDFNKFGRTYRVYVQADSQFRAHPQDILQLQTRNDRGEMVPLGAVVTVKEGVGPDRAMRYNAYRSAEINGGAAPGYSSGQAQSAIEKILREVLPTGVAFEWTELTYQQILSGNTALYVFPLCVLLVFLVLAAQYESFTLPLAVILIVPMCLLCAITGVGLVGGDNNLFTQIGLIVLVGLACKNAILIVEFARELESRGHTTVRAAIEASRQRLRPILMTSFAFIMGVLPLVTATGAGAEMRRAMGVAVFSGMLGVTFFGLLLTPVFYVVIRSLDKTPLRSHVHTNDEAPHA